MAVAPMEAFQLFDDIDTIVDMEAAETRVSYVFYDDSYPPVVRQPVEAHFNNRQAMNNVVQSFSSLLSTALGKLNIYWNNAGRHHMASPSDDVRNCTAIHKAVGHWSAGIKTKPGLNPKPIIISNYQGFTIFIKLVHDNNQGQFYVEAIDYIAVSNSIAENMMLRQLFLPDGPITFPPMKKDPNPPPLM